MSELLTQLQEDGFLNDEDRLQLEQRIRRALEELVPYFLFNSGHNVHKGALQCRSKTI